MNGAHIDAYQEYNWLVGEADGGALLPQHEYDRLRKIAMDIHRNGTRLYVYWRCKDTGMDCYCVGPDSKCFCGHSYKAHAWYEVQTKKVGCRVPGCRCSCFRYVNGRGMQFIRCQCKHEHVDHRRSDGRMSNCDKCSCKSFFSHWRCSCGKEWADHDTVFESKSERIASGRDVENVGKGGAAFEAACGGVTRFSSLVSGVERQEASLPYTDENNVRSSVIRAPLRAMPGQTFAEKMLQWDQIADQSAARNARLTKPTSSPSTSRGHSLSARTPPSITNSSPKSNPPPRSSSARRPPTVTRVVRQPSREEMRRKAFEAAEKRRQDSQPQSPDN